MNLGHMDCREIFGRALGRPIPEAFRLGKGSFGVAYAVSNNSRRVFDLSSTEALLGYAPVEDAELFFQSAAPNASATGRASTHSRQEPEWMREWTGAL